jgi:H+-transporting ATPase
MTPIGWKMAGIVWSYTLVMFLFQDRVKLLAYRILGKECSGLITREART